MALMNALARVMLGLIVVTSASAGLAHGDCTVQNNSGKKVIMVPVEVNVKIEVDVGASISVPKPQQDCYFQNAETGHQLGPVTLKDGTLVVLVDGAVSGTVDCYLGVISLLGILKLTVKIFVSL